MAYASVLKTDGREVLWVRPPPALWAQRKGWYHTRYQPFAQEATMGFEPMIEVLQTSALPLGYVAEVTLF